MNKISKKHVRKIGKRCVFVPIHGHEEVTGLIVGVEYSDSVGDTYVIEVDHEYEFYGWSCSLVSLENRFEHVLHEDYKVFTNCTYALPKMVKIIH